MDNNENNKIEKPIAFLMIATGTFILSLAVATMSALMYEIVKLLFI